LSPNLIRDHYLHLHTNFSHFQIPFTNSSFDLTLPIFHSYSHSFQQLCANVPLYPFSPLSRTLLKTPLSVLLFFPQSLFLQQLPTSLVILVFRRF
jgi:hypothetical protein